MEALEIILCIFCVFFSITCIVDIGVCINQRDRIKSLKKELDALKADFTDFERDHKIMERLKDIPLQSWQNPCYDPNLPCMNPQKDCINCPRTGLTDGIITTTEFYRDEDLKVKEDKL